VLSLSKHRSSFERSTGRKGRPFDKLRANGVGVDRYIAAHHFRPNGSIPDDEVK